MHRRRVPLDLLLLPRTCGAVVLQCKPTRTATHASCIHHQRHLCHSFHVFTAVAVTPVTMVTAVTAGNRHRPPQLHVLSGQLPGYGQWQ